MANNFVKLTRILFRIIAILTLLLILICISDNKELIQKFCAVYGISLILFLISLPIATFVKLKSLPMEDSQNRIIRFVKFFIDSFIVLSLFSIIFKPNSHDMFNNIVTSLSSSFGLNFLDLLIFKNN
ncbi:MAG: hypothetical protein E6902_12945 [Paeniclostridium sordellii]|nr:hypothetical protein [Paeniclostridium sordellii]